MKKNQAQAKRQEVTLLRDHTHAGRKYRASDTIEVTEPVRNWLLAQHVIADVTETPATAAE